MWLWILWLAWPLSAQDWQQQLLQAPRPPQFQASPDGRYLLLAEPQAYSDLPLADGQLLGQQFASGWPLELSQPLLQHIKLLQLPLAQAVAIPQLPGLALELRFAPDSQQLAAVVLLGTRLRLFHYQLGATAWTPWHDIDLKAVNASGVIRWAPDSQAILVRAGQPNVACPAEQTQVRRAQRQPQNNRIYRDHLSTASRQCQFNQFWQQKLLWLPRVGTSKTLAQGLIEDFSWSPDGQYVLLQQLSQPLATDLPLRQLGRQYQVIALADLQQFQPVPAQVAQAVKMDQAPAGGRQIQWLAHAPATLGWLQQGPEGGDLLYTQPAPFGQPKTLLFQSDWRIYQWFSASDGRLLVGSWRFSNHQMRWHWLTPAQKQVSLISQFDYKVPAQDPGIPLQQRLAWGGIQLWQAAAGSVHFQRPDGQLLQARQQDRLRPVAKTTDWVPLLWPDAAKTTEFLAVRDVTARASSYWWVRDGQARQLADWSQALALTLPAAELLSLPNGLAGRLYAPAAACPKPWPLLIWLYPDATKGFAEPISTANSPFFALQLCMAVLDLAGQPLPDRDAGQLIMQLIKREPLLDAARSWLMGHSFGANAVVSLLASSSLFQGGIARSGAYNRSLTPLGFQKFQQTLWQSPSFYLQHSPFWQADKITQPLLLVHGDADQNPGTLPLQSAQLFEALQHFGQDVELLMLPGEGHEYQRRSSLQLLLATQTDWLARQLRLSRSTQQISSPAALKAAKHANGAARSEHAPQQHP